MIPFTTHSGIAVPLLQANIDTDQIIPKQFLTRIERTGYGEFLFFDWRYKEDGKRLREDFVLNLPRYRGVSVLVAGRNFGCGSSREHAPWALEDFGFRVIIAPSFADIFYNNCFKVGILAVTLEEELVEALARKAESREGYSLTVDLGPQTVTDGDGFSAEFSVDPFRKHCLLNGLDDIGLSLCHEEAISSFEAARPRWM